MSKIISINLSPEEAAFNETINENLIKQTNKNDIIPSQWKILKNQLMLEKRCENSA